MSSSPKMSLIAFSAEELAGVVSIGRTLIIFSGDGWRTFGVRRTEVMIGSGFESRSPQSQLYFPETKT